MALPGPLWDSPLGALCQDKGDKSVRRRPGLSGKDQGHTPLPAHRHTSSLVPGKAITSHGSKDPTLKGIAFYE